MKNYFKFNLTGKQVLPVWLIFMVVFLIPYGFVQYKIQGFKAQGQDPHEAMNLLGDMFKWYGVMAGLIFVEYAMAFFFLQLGIQAIELKEKSIVFVGKFSKFLSLIISGFLLTIITIGIYSPWFLTKMYNFFAKQSSYDENSFEFKGTGGDLFLIMLFTIIIPMLFLFFIIMIIALIIGFRGHGAAQTDTGLHSMVTVYAMIVVLIVMLVMVPYLYYTYKWKVNFTIKQYTIQWETSFWNAAGKIAAELALSLITFGIYAPLATLKLFKYFSEQTIAKSADNSKKFGYDIEPAKDFTFIWGQALLTIITLGVYTPWAVCKIAERVFGKTYVEEIAG